MPDPAVKPTAAQLEARLATVETWAGCYDDSWRGYIVDDSFQHPAKFARGLIERIYKHMLAEGMVRRGECVVDPFGGVGTGGVVAASNGLRWIGCELEQKFIALANQNFTLHLHTWAQFADPIPMMVQGDSRRLREHLRGVLADGVVCSPPFIDPIAGHRGSNLERVATGRLPAMGAPDLNQYGQTAGQLGSMPTGSVDSIVSSPPYAEQPSNSRTDHGLLNHAPDCDCNFCRKNRGNAGMSQGYRRADAIISSPPYSACLRGDNTAKETAEESRAKRLTEGGSLGKSMRHHGYGSRSNLGNIRAGTVEEAICQDDTTCTTPAQTAEDASDSVPPDACHATTKVQLSGSQPVAGLPTSHGQKLPDQEAGDGKAASTGIEGQHGISKDARHSLGTAGGASSAEIAQRSSITKRTRTKRAENGTIHSEILSPDATGATPSLIQETEQQEAQSASPAVDQQLPNATTSNLPFAAISAGRPGEQRNNDCAAQGLLLPSGARAGEVSAVVSSPPYASGTVHDGNGVDVSKLTGNKAGRNSQAARMDAYGTAPGQLGNLPAGVVDSVVSSPPYEGSEGTPSVGRLEALSGGTASSAAQKANGMTASYGNGDGQLGHTTGETFWSAARDIVSECHAILKPGGYAAFVVKAFVRDKQIVDFPGDWRKLCEACGFELVQEVHAMLVKEDRHPDLFGGETVKVTARKSFFRRLYERKYPGNSIDFEVVQFFRKRAA